MLLYSIILLLNELLVNFREGRGSGKVWQTFSACEFTLSKIKSSFASTLFEINHFCFKIAFVVGSTDHLALRPFHQAPSMFNTDVEKLKITFSILLCS